MLPPLPALARHALDCGHTPAETYAILAGRTHKPLPAARAAYLSLAAVYPLPRTGDPARYWTTLVEAGELLIAEPAPDPRIRTALTHCRSRAATHAATTS